MFELDKTTFGKFLTEQRKTRGYTQKELAAKLFVSDKAVSKWERGLSMPDISLLIPLAEILEVSVTELLEGRRLDPAAEMNAGQVETLVKKALTLSEVSPEKQRALRRKNAAVFLVCVLSSLLELGLGAWYLLKAEGMAPEALLLLSIMPLVLESLGLGFGLYFWLFIKPSLPAYYDENRISVYTDGAFSMSVPGLSFNNGNWPHIVKCLRLWSALTLTAAPPVCLLLALTVSRRSLFFTLMILLLIACLVGMFLPLYLVGRKYGTDSGKTGNAPAARRGAVLALSLAFFLPLLLLPLLFSASGAPTYSAVRTGFTASYTRQEWSASYRRLDGSMVKTIHPESGAYLIEINTVEGSLSIEMTDSSGNTVFSAADLSSGSYQATLSDVTKVKITADHHRGGFSIAPLKPSP